MITLLNGLWQGVVLTALVWAMLKIVPRCNAASRYAIWWLTLLAVVLLPLWPRGNRMSSAPVARSMSSAAIDKTNTTPVTAATDAPPAETQTPPRAPSSVHSSGTALQNWRPIHVPAQPVTVAMIALWAMMSLVLLTRLARAFGSLWQLKLRATPAPEALRQRLNRLAESVGVERRARLLVSDDVAAPMALGLFDPAILLPASMPQRLSESDFDHVALHELAHLQRYDDWMNLLQKLIEALFPIQPAVFWISRQLTLERETACDDWVIAAKGGASGYATTLTRVAELTLWARSGILASGAAGNPSQLYRRVHRLLDPRRNIAPRASAMLLLLGALLVTALGSACAHSPRVVALADSPVTTASGGSSSAPTADSQAQGQSGTLPAHAGTQKRTFSVQLNDTLKVEIDRGEVLVSTSQDLREAQITVTQKGRDIDEFVKHHTITISQSGHEVRVHAKADRSMPSNLSDVQIEYEIKLPNQFNADLANSLGRLEVNDLKGKLNARASLGEISMNKIDGPLNGELSQGRFEASDCSGDVQATVSAGELTVKHFTGPSVHATVSAGNVSVEFAQAPSKDCSLTASAGNVAVTIPSSAAIDVDASTSMGSIQSELALQSQHGVTGGTLHGSLNGGGPTLKLAASMGNIQISKQ